MKNLRVALLVAMTAATLLAGCGTDGDDATAGPTGSPTQDGAATPGEDQTPADDGAAGGAAGGTQPATVALSFDGQPVPIVLACNGADGGVVVTTEGEVTITLVAKMGQRCATTAKA